MSWYKSDFRFSRSAIRLALWYCFFGGGYLYSQVTVQGEVVDSLSNTPLVNAYVIVLQKPDENTVSYAITDQEGRYEVSVAQAGTYTLKVSYLGYRAQKRDLVYDGTSSRRLVLDFALPVSSAQTEMVSVTAERPPIIIQGDTTTFAVDNWAEVDDEDLEAVLKKIPGFSVAADGELTYRGKKIEKVLVDGKVVANVGAAILTRGIASKHVASVQVREKDQNSKFKNSLLDTDGVMVLDIALKSEYQLSTFGRARTGVGVAPYVRPQAYASVFRLRKKQRWHLLTEYEGYGSPKISIVDIKNLGREAYAELFNTPADFSRLKEREDYGREIYGFDQFDRAEDATLALSLSTDLSEHTRLFIGSYQNLDGQTVSQSGQQFLVDTSGGIANFSSSLTESVRQFDSKNKIELDYSTDSLKIRYNLNGLYATGESSQVANFSDALGIRYSPVNEGYSIYQNLHAGWLSGVSTISIDAYYGVSKTTRENNYEINGFSTRFLFADDNGYANFRQDDREQEQVLIADAKLRRPVLAQLPVTFGYRYLDKKITGDRSTPILLAGNDSLDRFVAATTDALRLQSHTPYLTTDLPLGSVFLSGKLGYNFYQYPDHLPGQGRVIEELLEYTARLSYDPGKFAILLSYQRQASAFPLAALRQGWTISRYNTVVTPANGKISLQPERTFQLSLNTNAFKKKGLDLQAALAYGETYNSPIIAGTQSPVVVSEYAQNPSSYWILSSKQQKIFLDSPWSLRLEQGLISNTQVNQTRGEDAVKYATTFTAMLVKTELQYLTKNKRIGVTINHGYSDYRFGNDVLDNAGSQQLNSLQFIGFCQLFEKKIRLGLTANSVWLSSSTNTDHFGLFDLHFRYRPSKGIFRLGITNLANIRNFEQRSIDPVVFNIQNRSIFGRSAQLTYQFDF